MSSLGKRCLTASVGLLLTVSLACLPTIGAAHGKQARVGTLTTFPQSYTAGQAITFTGNTGRSGVRPISLQLHMGRPGDTWFPVRGFAGRTQADGSFHFTFPAPSMYNIRYRVVSPGVATTPVIFSAVEQDIQVRVASSDPDAPWRQGHAVAGRPFALSVSTSPVLPVFDGRLVTLEVRTQPGVWQDLGSTRLLPDGTATFAGLVVDTPGTAVYRVVQGDVATGGSRIGWTQSWPTYVTVHAPGTEPSQEQLTKGKAHVRDAQISASSTAGQQRRGGEAPSATAAAKYRWWPVLYDYTWESGQSLASPPDQGTLKSGRWEDWGDGTGRVSRHNGGLHVASGPGDSDHGTTHATLRGAGMTQGRWETRLRFVRTGDFPVRVELVPANPADYACGVRNILLAEVSSASPRMTFGVNANGRQWRGTRAYGALTSAPSLAVEVGGSHITWFLNGRAIGTVKDKVAVPGVPMTLRYTVLGGGSVSTAVNSDWQRAFAIRTGRQVTKAPKLASTPSAGCPS